MEIMTTLEEDEGEVIFEDKNVKFKEPTPKNKGLNFANLLKPSTVVEDKP